MDRSDSSLKLCVIVANLGQSNVSLGDPHSLPKHELSCQKNKKANSDHHNSSSSPELNHHVLAAVQYVCMLVRDGHCVEGAMDIPRT